MDEKGIAGSIILGIFVIAILVIAYISLQAIGNYTVDVASESVDFINLKSQFDFDKYFLNNSLNYSIGDGTYENGISGGFQDYTGLKTKTMNGKTYVFWKEGCGSDLNRIPTEEKISSELEKSIRYVFKEYDNKIISNGEILNFEFEKDSNGKYPRDEIDLNTKLRIVAKDKSGKIEYSIFDTFDTKYSYKLRYFLLYDYSNKFVENLDGLINYRLWETIFNYEDHKEGSYSGCKDTCGDGSTSCSCCGDKPCPDLNDVFSKVDPDSDLEDILNNLENSLNSISQTGISWKIDLIDFWKGSF